MAGRTHPAPRAVTAVEASRPVTLSGIPTVTGLASGLYVQQVGGVRPRHPRRGDRAAPGRAGPWSSWLTSAAPALVAAVLAVLLGATLGPRAKRCPSPWRPDTWHWQGGRGARGSSVSACGGAAMTAVAAWCFFVALLGTSIGLIGHDSTSGSCSSHVTGRTAGKCRVSTVAAATASATHVRRGTVSGASGYSAIDGWGADISGYSHPMAVGDRRLAHLLRRENAHRERWCGHRRRSPGHRGAVAMAARGLLQCRLDPPPRRDATQRVSQPTSWSASGWGSQPSSDTNRAGVDWALMLIGSVAPGAILGRGSRRLPKRT